MKKKNLVVFLSVLLPVLLVGSMIFFLYVKLDPKITENERENVYNIIVDDEITVYSGDTYTLVPYLVNYDGEVVPSTFEYSASSELSVTPTGVISVNSVPEKPVELKIHEMNTGTDASVTVNVVDHLSHVLGVTFSDMAGNKMLVQGKQLLHYGETYVIDIITEPAAVEIGSFCTFSAKDEKGTEKEVFDVSYRGGSVTLNTVGIGAGEIELKIASEDEEFYNLNLEFEIDMNEGSLMRDIFAAAEGETLLSKGDLNGISTLVLHGPDAEEDPRGEGYFEAAELNGLSSLRTVILPSGALLRPSGVEKDLVFRVPLEKFNEYYEDAHWQSMRNSLIPYADGKGEDVYFVLHNRLFATMNEEAGEERYAEIVLVGKNDLSASTLAQYSATGYRHKGWTFEESAEGDPAPVTLEDLRRVTLNGCHVFADWEPVSFTVVYHVSGADALVVEDTGWNYETKSVFSTPALLGATNIRAGYRFAGWTTNNLIPDKAEYLEGEEYTHILPPDGEDALHLYDVWTVKRYTVHFDLPEDAEPMEDAGANATDPYRLPEPVRRGYRFEGWYLNGVKTDEIPVDDGTMEDGAELTVTAKWTENSYTITFDYGGGVLANGGAAEKTKTLRYSDPYPLPALVYDVEPFYPHYYWFADLNENGVKDEEEPQYDAGATVSKIVAEGGVKLTAFWYGDRYSVKFDPNGGRLLESPPTDHSFEDVFVLPRVERTGYTFTGWKCVENDKTYGPEQQIGQLGSEDGEVFNFVAQWSENHYTVYYDTAGADIDIPQRNVAYSASFSLPTARKTGNTNVSWTDLATDKVYNPGETVSKLSSKDGGFVTLKASYTVNNYRLIRSNGDQGDHCNFTVNVTYGGSTTRYTVSANGGSVSIPYGAAVDVDIAADDHNCVRERVECVYNISITDDHRFTMPAADVTLRVKCTKNHVCIAEGSLITMADGSQKPVEQLRFGDEIMVFNHDTGKLDVSSVSHLSHADGQAAMMEVLTLRFEGGVTTSLIDKHGYFDIDLKEYVILSERNVAEYVGHRFFYTEGQAGESEFEARRLVGYSVTQKMTRFYSLSSAVHYNHIVDGMLAMASGIEGLYNIFELDDELKYDAQKKAADIERYGLYTYEDFAAYLPPEAFEIFRVAELKVAVGKGLITYEKILEYIEEFLRGDISGGMFQDPTGE